LAKQSLLLNSWVEATLSRFALSSASTLQVEDLAQVALPELRDLGDCLDEILDFAAQLERFSNLNRDALQRLFEKPSLAAERKASILTSDGLLHTRPWIDTASHVRRLLDSVQQATNIHDNATETRSLLLEHVTPLVLGCTSDEVHQTILADDSAALMCVMASPVSYLENQAMLYSVLQVAIAYRSPRCIQSLLEEITVPSDEVVCGHQDALQQLIAQLSRLNRHNTHFHPQVAEMRVLEDTFRELSPYQHNMLLAKDWRQRFPLHYAAQYGLVDVCSQIIKFMEPAAALEPDLDGQTPLELAVWSGQLAVVRLLLELDATRSMLSDQAAGTLLSMAIRANLSGVAKCFIELGKGLNFQGRHGQTPLFIAARTGQAEVVEALLAMSPNLDLGPVEASRCWTPLIVACAHDHIDVVKLLAQAGVDVLTLDRHGWSAVDHAAYRGHMTMVTLLQQALDTQSGPNSICIESLALSRPSKRSHTPRPTCVSTQTPHPDMNPHLTSVFVNLGSFDLHTENQGLELETCVARQGQFQSMESHMQLEISAHPCQDQPHKIQLPYLGDLSSVTWRFLTSDPEAMRLTFKLFQFTGSSEPRRRLVGSAVVLLKSIKGWFRPGRQSLRRDSTVALITPDGNFGGSVTFTFLGCRPYIAPGSPKPTQTMRSLKHTQVVGHRGTVTCIYLTYKN
jgi:glycerophosphodiester phosphodiesterase